MTIKELIEELKSFNPDMEVLLEAEEGEGDGFAYASGPITHIKEHFNERDNKTVLYIGYNDYEES